MNRVLVRSVAEVRGRKVGGYAAVFGQPTDLGPGRGREQLAPTAFAAALKASDVRALREHNPLLLLGRESAGTLKLLVDSTGLEWEADPPDVEYARDLRVLVERGDIDGASFGFVPGESDWDSTTQVRTHTSVKLLVDVSAVTFPAYEGASTEARTEEFGTRVPNRQRSQLIRARARVHLGGTTR